MSTDILRSDKFEDGIIGTLLWLDEARPVLMPKLTVDSFTSAERRAAESVKNSGQNKQE